MHQTKLVSLIESIVNQLSGILIAFLTWRYFVIPVFNIPDPGFASNITITLTFTTISIIRSFIWRRFFNAGLHAIVVNAVKNKVNGVT